MISVFASSDANYALTTFACFRRVLLKLDVMKLNMMFSMNEIHDMNKHLHNVIASLWFFVQHSVDVSRLICWCVSAFGYA